LKKVKEKKIIGTLDKVDFPEFELEEVACKIDTGAATSAIHCHQVKEVERNGEQFLSFRLLDPAHASYNHKQFLVKDFSLRKIRSSNGQLEERYVIKAIVIIFGKRIKADFTLADRVKMKYPVLLGKKLLKNRFLVDVSKLHLSWKEKNGL